MLSLIRYSNYGYPIIIGLVENAIGREYYQSQFGVESCLLLPNRERVASLSTNAC